MSTEFNQPQEWAQPSARSAQADRRKLQAACIVAVVLAALLVGGMAALRSRADVPQADLPPLLGLPLPTGSAAEPTPSSGSTLSTATPSEQSSSSEPTPSEEPTAQEAAPTDAETFTLTNPDTDITTAQVGACTHSDWLTATSLNAIPLVDCAVPHNVEVVGIFLLEGTDYPGETQMRADSINGCTPLFTDYIGASPQDSELGMRFINPSEGTWDDSGDREVICFATSSGPNVTGSWAGTGT